MNFDNVVLIRLQSRGPARLQRICRDSVTPQDVKLARLQPPAGRRSTPTCARHQPVAMIGSSTQRVLVEGRFARKDANEIQGPHRQ